MLWDGSFDERRGNAKRFVRCAIARGMVVREDVYQDAFISRPWPGSMMEFAMPG
jgi:hypothetical protein